jgi:hypothetical protein
MESNEKLAEKRRVLSEITSFWCDFCVAAYDRKVSKRGIREVRLYLWFAQELTSMNDIDGAQNAIGNASIVARQYCREWRYPWTY